MIQARFFVCCGAISTAARRSSRTTYIRSGMKLLAIMIFLNFSLCMMFTQFWKQTCNVSELCQGVNLGMEVLSGSTDTLPIDLICLVTRTLALHSLSLYITSIYHLEFHTPAFVCFLEIVSSCHSVLRNRHNYVLSKSASRSGLPKQYRTPSTSDKESPDEAGMDLRV